MHSNLRGSTQSFSSLCRRKYSNTINDLGKFSDHSLKSSQCMEACLEGVRIVFLLEIHLFLFVFHSFKVRSGMPSEHLLEVRNNWIRSSQACPLSCRKLRCIWRNNKNKFLVIIIICLKCWALIATLLAISKPSKALFYKWEEWCLNVFLKAIP